jgi:hypothetical protein
MLLSGSWTVNAPALWARGYPTRLLWKRNPNIAPTSRASVMTLALETLIIWSRDFFRDVIRRIAFV